MKIFWALFIAVVLGASSSASAQGGEDIRNALAGVRQAFKSDDPAARESAFERLDKLTGGFFERDDPDFALFVAILAESDPGWGWESPELNFAMTQADVMADPDLAHALRMALAQSYLAQSDFDRALTGYRDAAGAAANDVERSEARLGIASVLTLMNPAQALVEARSAEGGSGSHPMSAKLLAARAALIAGNRPEAERIYGALGAGLAALQPNEVPALVMMRDLSAYAAGTGDAETAISKRTFDRGYDANIKPILEQFHDALPLCDETLSEADFAVLEIAEPRGRWETDARPVMASSVAAARAFYRSVSRAEFVGADGRLEPFHVLLRCLRTAIPGLSYERPPDQANQLAERLPFVLSLGQPRHGDEDAIAHLARRLIATPQDQAARRAALLIRLGQIFLNRNSAAAAAYFAEAVPLVRAQAGDGAAAYVGYAMAIAKSADLETETPIRAFAESEDFAHLPPPIRADLLMRISSWQPDHAQALGKLEDAKRALGDGDGTAERRLNRIIATMIMQRKNSLGQAKASASPMPCAWDVDLSPTSITFSESDYDPALAYAEIEGFVVEEIDVSESGASTAHRAVLETAPFLLARQLDGKLDRLAFEPPRLNGQAVACSGAVQSFSWELND